MSVYLRVLTFLACITLAGPVFAQTATATIGSVDGVAGQTVVVPVNFTAGSDIAGIEIDVDFTAASFSSVSLDCTVQTVGAAFNFCDDSSPGTAAIKLARIDGAVLTDGLLANISFTIGASAEGAQALDGVFVAASDTGGIDLGAGSVVITDGAVNVLGAAYSSDPVPGAFIVGSVVQGNPDISRDLTITNTGADGSTLSVDCSKSNDAGNVFTITNGTGDIASGASAAVTVSCDASSPVDTHTATMSCAHNGDGTGESSPAVYDLSCTVNAAPAPLYSSVPAAGTPVNMSATFENDPITPVDLTITNVGDDGTTLTGSCSFSGSAKISLTPGGAFSLPKGSSSVQTLSCDSTEEGVYNGTLSCTHDGPASSSPATHAVECTVGPPPPPQFSSNPAAGSSPSISPPDGTPQNESPAPTSALVFSNTAPAGSDDLEISCSNTGGTGAAISVDLNSFLIPAGGSATATFTCATDTVGQNTYEYSCDYGRPSSTPSGTAVYTYTCEVRDPVSDVEPDPVSGTTLTQEVGEGETGVFQVVFNELANEGEPGELTSCQLTDGTNFTITDPTVYPAAIPAGGSVTVTVEGTAPDGEAMANDTLECTYRDSSSGEVGPTASYPLELVVSTGTLARILVTKTFSDGITDEVTMTLSCNGGFTNADSVQVAGGDPSGFTFVITTFEDGALDCTVTESGGPSGYSSNMPNGCSFTDMSTDASPYACAFVNTATNGTFTVSKVWEDLGGPDSEIELVTTLQVDCTRDIVSATPSCTSGDANTCVWENVVGDVNGVLTIDNSQGSASCTVSEPIVGEGVEASGCETAVTVSAGSNVGCTITNTVFFEGIPTLSQYGLAIMALLMLGIGLVGFRRFA